MTKYKLKVKTGGMPNAGTLDQVYVTLFGTEGQSERTELDNFGIDFVTATTGNYTIKNKLPLGKLLLLKVEKDPFFAVKEDDEWFCSKMEVKTPEGEVLLFPCYRWISRGEMVELRGGRALKVFQEDNPLLIEHRKKELALKKSLYQWNTIAEGLPYTNGFTDVSELPAEVRFSKARTIEMEDDKRTMGIEFKLKGLLGSSEKWKCFEDMKKIFGFKKTTMSEYVTEHWKEDAFYGYQFLNGVNPNVIKLCSELPPNFPVTEELVRPFLEGSTLKREMEKGNIFIYDQKKMHDLRTRNRYGVRLDMTAGLCLFYMNPDNELMPIAIQLHQNPCEENPIFLPSDLQTDWLLAKMFIKNADCQDHEAVHHLLNTHLLAEVFTLATLRNFPVIHPLYKLLVPHGRYSLYINTVGLPKLLGPGGAFRLSTLGYDGMVELMRRSHCETTYSSLCLPENIRARGLESIPNFYYRDDGLRLWDIINSFVKAMVEYFYPSDSEVLQDTELQEWISDIFTHGFLGNKASGFPSAFQTVEEVVKFVTMVIFTVTAQHAAVSNGQFDHYSWEPNGSILLCRHSPTTKGRSSMDTILENLPNIGETVKFAALTWQLSDTYSDMIYLGSYPEERFNEPATKQMIEAFQEQLSCLSESITTRNSTLEVPYTYLNPNQIENSVTI